MVFNHKCLYYLDKHYFKEEKLLVLYILFNNIYAMDFNYSNKINYT